MELNNDESPFFICDEDMASMMASYEASYENNQSSYQAEDEGPVMTIDWEEANQSNKSTFWAPVRQGTYGEFSPAEMQLASAGFFNEGDIGNDQWRAVRQLPFRDFDSELIGIGYNAMLLYAYEDHPERQPKVNAAKDFKEYDPTMKWALDEQIEVQEKLAVVIAEGYDLDKVAKLNDRVYQLTEFISEMSGYNEKIAEDALFFVPDYYLDSLTTAMEHGLQFDPKIVLESGERSNLRSDPVSVTKLPSMGDVKVFHNLYDDYVIEGVREWCPAIIDGKQEFGAYGQKVSAIRLLKPNAREDGREVSEYREVVLQQMLRDFEIFTGKNDTLEYRGQASLEAATRQYADMASEISAISSTNAAILQHREQLKQSLRAEARDEIFENWTIELHTGNKLGWAPGVFKAKAAILQVLQDEERRLTEEYLCMTEEEKDIASLPYVAPRHMLEVNPEQIREAFMALFEDPLEAENYLTYLDEKVTDKTELATYLLQTKLQWGWEVFQVTREESLAEDWRNARAEDIPYFKAPAALRNKVLNYSQTLDNTNSVAEAEYASSRWLSLTKITEGELQRQVQQFNNGHKVKKIQSRFDRASGWLLSQMVLTTAQLRVARSGLSAIGRYIINLRRTESSEESKLAFRRLQMVLGSKLHLRANDKIKMSRETLERIVQGSVDFHFTWEITPFASERQRNIMLRRRMCTRSEVEGYVNPKMNFNKNIVDQTQTFNLVRGFRPSKENQDLAAAILDSM